MVLTSANVECIASEGSEKPTGRTPIDVVVRANKQSYSQADVVRLYISLENVSDEIIYVDRSLLLGGPIYGLGVEIKNEEGKAVCCGFVDAHLPPPPPMKDALIRLDENRFYGMWVDLNLKEFSLKPGQYSIRASYRSYLERGDAPPRLEDLSPVWRTQPIPSAPISIRVSP